MLDLGDFGDGTEGSWANGVSRAGVVGWADNSKHESRAFLYNGGLHDLGTLGGDYAQAQAINDAGQIVGRATDADGNTHAFLYQGGMAAIGPAESYAYGINDLGHVVGLSGNSAFLYDGGLRSLGNLPGGSGSAAYGINNLDQVVGEANAGAGMFGYHAFLCR